MPGRSLTQKLRQNPLPIARGSSGDCQTGSSPGSGSLLAQTFPRLSSQWHSYEFAPHYSGGTAPALHRTSLLSPYGHLSRYEIIKIRTIIFYIEINYNRILK